MAEQFLDGYVPYLLQRADQLLSARFYRSLQRRGVQPSEWRVLAVLLDQGPQSIGALTDRSLLPQPTTTHAVTRLEARGDVRRSTTTVDRRRRIVALTSRGRRRATALIDSAQADLATSMAAAGVKITGEFVEQLRSTIRKLERGSDSADSDR
jgi:MarR family transcriptional regulator, organic hydroperoxide resistance regulator